VVAGGTELTEGEKLTELTCVLFVVSVGFKRAQIAMILAFCSEIV